MIWKVIVAIIFISIPLFVILQYNALVKLRNWVKESWSQIDVQLRRRHDLIPNLVNAVKGYAEHEKATLEQVIRARNAIMEGNPQERIEADNQIKEALKSIFALAEDYPELKANRNFSELQAQLTETENKIAYSRQLYNRTVAEYNIKRESFPSNIIANMFQFQAEDLLVIHEEERETPAVTF